MDVDHDRVRCAKRLFQIELHVSSGLYFKGAVVATSRKPTLLVPLPGYVRVCRSRSLGTIRSTECIATGNVKKLPELLPLCVSKPQPSCMLPQCEPQELTVCVPNIRNPPPPHPRANAALMTSEHTSSTACPSGSYAMGASFEVTAVGDSPYTVQLLCASLELCPLVVLSIASASADTPAPSSSDSDTAWEIVAIVLTAGSGLGT